METYRITCREEVYFIKEVKADSENEALTRLYSEDLQPYKNTPTKSNVMEVYET